MIALAAFLGVSAASERVIAQTRQMRSRVPARVFVTDSFPYPGNAVVLRRRDTSPQDVILMRSGAAQASDLSEAVRTLLEIRAVAGDSAAVDGMFRSRSTSATRTHTLLPWAERVLRDASAQKPDRVDHVGHGRSITIWLPATQNP